LKALANGLGLLEADPEVFFQGGIVSGDTELGAEAVEVLIQQRLDARENRDWAEADRIRDQLKEQGIVLEDGACGTTWRRA
jgi:cysteinyl-tRNA synthetase